jgi:hypothetical protein
LYQPPGWKAGTFHKTFCLNQTNDNYSIKGVTASQLAEIKVNVPEEVEKKFRKTAKSIYGEDKNAEDKAATEALTKWSSDREEALIVAKASQKSFPEFKISKEEDVIDPNDPIFTHLTIGSKTGKKTRVSVDHDKYLYGKP